MYFAGFIRALSGLYSRLLQERNCISQCYYLMVIKKTIQDQMHLEESQEGCILEFIYERGLL